MMTRGLPETSFAARRDRTHSADRSISVATMMNTGTTLPMSGSSGDSIEIEARLEIKIVETSSEGCSSPSWRLPIRRSPTMISA